MHLVRGAQVSRQSNHTLCSCSLTSSVSLPPVLPVLPSWESCSSEPFSCLCFPKWASVLADDSNSRIDKRDVPQTTLVYMRDSPIHVLGIMILRINAVGSSINYEFVAVVSNDGYYVLLQGDIFIGYNGGRNRPK